MGSFSKLPYEVKENIFSRIRIRDLYEVSVVAEEWWWLTVKTCKRILSEEDQLIKSLLAFYNREKKASTTLMWFELVNYASFGGIRLRFRTNPCPALLQKLLESRKPVRVIYLKSAFLGKVNRIRYLEGGLEVGSRANRGNESIKTKLNDILKYLPHLSKLSLNSLDVDSKSLKIPKGITQVRLYDIEVDGLNWSSLFEDPESIQSLELLVEGLTYDQITFKNLRSLSLYFQKPLDVNEMKNIQNLIRGHTLLRSVTLFVTKITKEWFNLFGKTIEKIILTHISIDMQLLAILGNGGSYERRVMSYVCSDFRTVKEFTLAYLSKHFGDLDYRAEYTCRPHLMEEKLYLMLDSSLSREVQTITSTDTGPALRDLNIRCVHVKGAVLRNCVPASVKKFKMVLEGEIENLSIAQLCEQPRNLEELILHSYITTSLSIQRDCFTLCTQLKILEMAHVNREGLQNLLQHCLSLEKLNLNYQERGCFSDLSPACINETIREVNLDWSDERLEDVLYPFPNLEVLRLSSYPNFLASAPTAIAKLKLFSATFSKIRCPIEYKTTVMVLSDTIDVPCKLFHSDSYSGWCTFKCGSKVSIIEDFHKTKGFAYCCGIPTRFLKAREINILADVQHFSERVEFQN